MPSAYVKTVEDLIFYEYAKLINKSAGFEANNFRFRTSTWKKLKSGQIKMSESIREWVIERKSRQICIYCGSEEKVQTEHIIPKSKGGPDIADNLVDSCQTCNLKKSNKDVFEFCAMLEMDVPRLVKGKILKLVYSKHEEKGTLQETDIDGDGKLNLLDLCAIFAKKENF
ncbi:MAG: HNH endonuclease [Methylococcaceae bacterium]